MLHPPAGAVAGRPVGFSGADSQQPPDFLLPGGLNQRFINAMFADYEIG
jgi:hypothetical protein